MLTTVLYHFMTSCYSSTGYGNYGCLFTNNPNFISLFTMIKKFQKFLAAVGLGVISGGTGKVEEDELEMVVIDPLVNTVGEDSVGGGEEESVDEILSLLNGNRRVTPDAVDERSNNKTGTKLTREVMGPSNELLVDSTELLKIVKESKGHVHIIGRHGSGKTKVVSQIMEELGQNVINIEPVKNKVQKGDILTPLINKLNIFKKFLKSFRQAQSKAINLISEKLSDQVIIIENIENGTKPRGML